MDSPELSPPGVAGRLPTHKDLPDRGGSVVQNFQEHPQAVLLTDTLIPRLNQLHPDGRFAIGQDCGIYWRQTNPPLDGCRCPDWFYVPNVPPLLDGEVRRSYVLWQELLAPLILIEFASGDGAEERDATPYRGKFWVYEQAIRAPFYAIFSFADPGVELYALRGLHYEQVQPNERGRFPVPPLGIELGVWEGRFLNQDLAWLRAWDAESGLLLPTGDERAEEYRRAAEQSRQNAETAGALTDDFRRLLAEESERAEHERRRAEQERRRAEWLAERLRSLGVDPDAA